METFEKVVLVAFTRQRDFLYNRGANWLGGRRLVIVLLASFCAYISMGQCRISG